MEIENKDDYFPTGPQEQVYSKGVYYWLVSKNYFHEHYFTEIVHSFDMHDEEFHTITLPNHFELSFCNTNNGMNQLFYFIIQGPNLL